jgi:hypothetical protein
MEYWNQYVNFVNATQPSGVSSHLSEATPTYWRDTIIWTILFGLVNLFGAQTIAYFRPKWYSRITSSERNADKTKHIGMVTASLFHHTFAAAIAVKFIYHDIIRSPEERLAYDYAAAYGFTIPISLGYLISDSIVDAIPNVNYAYMVHHLLAIGLFLSLYYTTLSGYIMRFYPYISITEITSVIFISNWFLKLDRSNIGGLTDFLEFLFIFLFAIIRLVHVAVAMHCAVVLFNHDQLGSEIGLGGWLLPIILYSILGMQYLWMPFIVKSYFKREKSVDNGIDNESDSSMKEGQQSKKKK